MEGDRLNIIENKKRLSNNLETDLTNQFSPMIFNENLSGV
jgi:hypothetical protein